MSHQSADESGNTSLEVGKTLAYIFIPDFNEWSESEQNELAEKIDHPIRKAAHATEYAILGILLGVDFNFAFLPALFTAALYASTDEIHQIFIAGRSGQLSDVLLDTAGATIGLLFLFFLVSLNKTGIGYEEQGKVKEKEYLQETFTA